MKLNKLGIGIMLLAITILSVKSHLYTKSQIIDMNLPSWIKIIDKLPEEISISNSSYYVIENSQFSKDNREFVFTAKYHGSLEINYTEIVDTLIITVIFNSNNELNVKIQDSDHKLFELPMSDPYPHDKVKLKGSIEADLMQYNVVIYLDPFSIQVIRTSTKEIVFDSSAQQLVLSNKYTSFGTYLPSLNIFGLGERFNYFKIQPNDYVIWDKDVPANGTLETGPTYGCHPVYLMQEKSKLFHIVFLRSVSDMDVNITTQGESEQQLTYSLVGGIIDLKFFFSDEKTPEPAVRLYHSYLDQYQLPAFWSLGYMHSRWGYSNWLEVNKIVEGYVQNQIPLDTYFVDIDYMDNYFIWSVDETLFPAKMLEFIKSEYNKTLVVIIDPSIAAYPFYKSQQSEYLPLRQAFEQNVLLNSLQEKNYPFFGKQWAGPVHYVDFSHPNASVYWTQQFQNFFSLLNYTGIWLDMNEVGHFSDGKYNMSEEAADLSMGMNYPSETDYECATEINDVYPYLPGGVCPSHRTLHTELIHYDGSEELYMHNLYGYHECIATHEAIKQVRQTSLPFVLTRANVFGSGKFASHWSGDNVSNFLHLKLSISFIMRHNFYGIPHVGADICGFQDATTPELCARWMQLGAMYPFSRNHNSYGMPDQAPFNQGHAATIAARKNLQLRYSILRHYYSLYMVHNGTGSVFKPLFFEFAEDEGTMHEEVINSQFLIGDALMVAPVLYEGFTNVSVYFPQHFAFYDFMTGNETISRAAENRSVLITNYLDDFIPIFLREGKTVVQQCVFNVNNTNQLNTEVFYKIGFEQVNASYYKSEGTQIMLGNVQDTELAHRFCRIGDCLGQIQVEWNQPRLIVVSLVANDYGNVNDMFLNDSGVSLVGVYLLGGYQDFVRDQFESGKINLSVRTSHNKQAQVVMTEAKLHKTEDSQFVVKLKDPIQMNADINFLFIVFETE